MSGSETHNTSFRWNPLAAMPAGHDFEVYHLIDESSMRAIFHSHPFYEFFFFLRGNISIQVEEHAYQVSPYDFFLFPPGYMHRNFALGPENIVYERAYFYLSESMLLSMDSEVCSLSGLIHHAVHTSRFHYSLGREICMSLVHRMDRIIETADSPSPLDQCINRARMTILLASICAAMSADPSPGSPPEHSASGRVIQYINTHLTEKISLDILAEELFMSKYHLLHAFKETTGMSIHQYVMMKRIVYAQLLMQNGVSPMQAAQESGFEDYAGFYRAFRNRTDYSPSEYVRRLGMED